MFGSREEGFLNNFFKYAFLPNKLPRMITHSGITIGHSGHYCS